MGNRDFKEILLNGHFRDKAAGKKKEANVKLLLVRISKKVCVCYMSMQLSRIIMRYPQYLPFSYPKTSFR